MTLVRFALHATGILLVASLSALPSASALCALTSGGTQVGCAYAPDDDCAVGAMPVTPVEQQDVVFTFDVRLAAYVAFACTGDVTTGICAFDVRDVELSYAGGPVAGNWACVETAPANGCAAGFRLTVNAPWVYAAC